MITAIKLSVICLILGLIIDAFGELRDQLEQVKEDMEVGDIWPFQYLSSIFSYTLVAL